MPGSAAASGRPGAGSQRQTAHYRVVTETWLTADLHLHHDHVAQIRGFGSAADHDAAVTAAWRRRVRDGDDIWVLGDIGLGGWRRALPVIGALPGRKHLVFGNHDPGHPMHRNGHTKHRAYLEVFETVHTSASLRHDTVTWVLSHFPYDGECEGRDGEERGLQWRLRDCGAPLFHGHTHAECPLSFSAAGTPQVCVGLDAWSLAPVTLFDAAAAYRPA